MQTSLSDILHVISQALLAPDIILLLILIAYAVFSIGSILVELITERRHYKVVMPQFLSSLSNASETLIPSVIAESGLLRRQKEALNTVYEYRDLPGDALIALVRRLMNQEEAHYDRIVDRNNMAARVAPMLGLVGTLIPLGPGIQALGNADTAQLSASLLVAFDTTVAGLVVAAVCLVIGKIRASWYANYLSALDSAMATMVQKIQDIRQPEAARTGGAAGADRRAYGAEGGGGLGYREQPMRETPIFMPAPAMVPPLTVMPEPPLPTAMPVATVVGQEAEAYTGAGMPVNSNYGYADGYAAQPGVQPPQGQPQNPAGGYPQGEPFDDEYLS